MIAFELTSLIFKKSINSCILAFRLNKKNYFRIDKNHGNIEFQRSSWFVGVKGRSWKTSHRLCCLFRPIYFFYLWGLGTRKCIIVSLKIVFLLYQEHTLFNPIPTLWNCESTIGRSCLWPVNQVTTRLKHIGDETINNFIMKRVVCLSAVRNVNTFGEHQND
jgi:hypothetical protein